MELSITTPDQPTSPQAGAPDNPRRPITMKCTHTHTHTDTYTHIHTHTHTHTHTHMPVAASIPPHDSKSTQPRSFNSHKARRFYNSSPLRMEGLNLEILLDNRLYCVIVIIIIFLLLLLLLLLLLWHFCHFRTMASPISFLQTSLFLDIAFQFCICSQSAVSILTVSSHHPLDLPTDSLPSEIPLLLGDKSAMYIRAILY